MGVARTMKFGVAITLLVLASGSTNAKEELLRRRDVGSTLARILSESNADERSDPFFIKPDWGEERSHDTKGPKSKSSCRCWLVCDGGRISPAIVYCRRVVECCIRNGTDSLVLLP